MLQEHWRQWVCPFGCGDIAIFSSSLRQHLGDVHAADVSAKSIDSFVSHSSRPDPQQSQGGCPLCRDVVIESSHHYESHVGHHLEQLALLALPYHDGVEKEEKGEHGETQSSSSNQNGDDEDARVAVIQREISKLHLVQDADGRREERNGISLNIIRRLLKSWETRGVQEEVRSLEVEHRVARMIERELEERLTLKTRREERERERCKKEDAQVAALNGELKTLQIERSWQRGLGKERKELANEIKKIIEEQKARRLQEEVKIKADENYIAYLVKQEANERSACEARHRARERERERLEEKMALIMREALFRLHEREGRQSERENLLERWADEDAGRRRLRRGMAVNRVPRREAVTYRHLMEVFHERLTFGLRGDSQ